MRTISSARSPPATSPITFADSPTGSGSQPSVSATRTFAPAESARCSRSASGIDSAAAGIGAMPAWYQSAPVCAARHESVPTDRTRHATAPLRAAADGPCMRTVEAPLYAVPSRDRCITWWR